MGDPVLGTAVAHRSFYFLVRTAKMKCKELIRVLKESVIEWHNSDAFTLGAALAYYAVFAIAPTLIIALAIAGIIFGPQAAQGHLQARLEQIVGPTVASAIEKILSDVHAAGGSWQATLIGAVVLIFGAIGVFTQLQTSLNAIWGVRPMPGRGIWGVVKDRLFSFLIVICFGILLVVSLAANAALSVVISYLPTEELPGGFYLWQALRWVVSFALLTVLFAVIYEVLPDVKLSWRSVAVGAAITALLFTLGNYLIGLYLGRSSVTSAYGAAGSLVIVLLWVYYSSQVVLLGAVFTRVYARYCGVAVEPSANAVAARPEMSLPQSLTPDRSHVPAGSRS
jgi:membrane protein